MDWQIRLGLIILGLAVLVYVLYDFQRKQKEQSQKQQLVEKMRNAAQQLDSQGFDFDGVGAVRKANIQSKIENVWDKAELNQTKEKTDYSQPEQLISLILKAEQGKAYLGNNFMPLMLSQGLRLGEMDIFHCYVSNRKKGNILYSVVNAVDPGTFDIKNIESFSTPALAFFMALPGSNDPIFAYNKMVNTIKLIQTELGGQILDASKSVYTEQTHQHQLDLLQDYVTKSALQK